MPCALSPRVHRVPRVEPIPAAGAAVEHWSFLEGDSRYLGRALWRAAQHICQIKDNFMGNDGAQQKVRLERKLGILGDQESEDPLVVGSSP